MYIHMFLCVCIYTSTCVYVFCFIYPLYHLLLFPSPQSCLVSSAGSISMELQRASTGLIRREKKLKRIGFLDPVGTFLLGLVVFFLWGGGAVGGLFDIVFWFGIT